MALMKNIFSIFGNAVRFWSPLDLTLTGQFHNGGRGGWRDVWRVHVERVRAGFGGLS